MVLGDPVANVASFKAEARYQSLCAVCERPGLGWHAHHVVYEQELRRLGMRGNELYDTRNALRLCGVCHAAHHARSKIVKTRKLRDANIEYAFDVLGTRAGAYLRRRYDDSDSDPRITEHEFRLQA